MDQLRLRHFGALGAAFGAAVFTLGMVGAAQAQSSYYPDGTPYYGQPAPAYRAGGHPLTVNRRYAPAPVQVAPAYNPYAGPQAVVTAPIAAASTLVALPFRVINGIFPADAHDPRVVVGAPVHAAGQLAQVPFRVVEAPFRGSLDYGYPEY